MNGFDKELYVATVATATIIINYANDVAGVWDRVLQDYLLLLSGALVKSVNNNITEDQCNVHGSV